MQESSFEELEGLGDPYKGLGIYRDCFVSFIDILGFADMIARTEVDEKLVPGLYRALSLGASSSPMVGPPNYPKGLTYSPHVTTNFSDSIVISAARDPEGLMTVLEMSRAFASVLLQYGLLCRGGVAGGRLFHDSMVLFGPAMVRAYRLESQQAKVARIILGEECREVAEACMSGGALIGEYFQKTIRNDTDGFSHIHVLRELEEDAGRSGVTYGEWWWGAVKKTVRSYLSVSDGKSFRNKVTWFCDYYDRCLASAPQGGDEDWCTPFRIEEGRGSGPATPKG